MKKLCVTISIVLCMTLLFSSAKAFADTVDDNILTLEEAKQIALDNDVQFNLQQSNIQKASESYENVYESNTKTDKTNYSNIAERAAGEVSRKITIEKAASSVRKAVFNRNDLKRESDYNVTEAYYGVLTAKLNLEDAEADKLLSYKELETAKIKYSLQIITKNTLSQAEDKYESSETAYNNAFTEVQKSMTTLSNSIGKTLDVFSDQIDMALSIPDIYSLDLNKIKEDYMENNSSFYSAKEEYDIAEYKLQLTQEKYDYYYKRLPNRTTTIEEKLNDMLYEAQRDFDDVKYSYGEKEKNLDLTLSNQYISINKSYKSYENLLKDLEEEKLTVTQNRIKYQMGLIKKAELESSEAEFKKLENHIKTAIANLIVQYVNMTQYDLE